MMLSMVHRFISVAVFLILCVVLLASSWAILTPGFFRVHDFTHAARIAEMTRSLQAGQFPVRWTESFGFGYGMPLFEFYAPLPYYVGTVFFWLGLSAVGVIKLLFLIANAGTVIGSYRLGKKLYGAVGGVVVATALTLAPYRAVNLYIRGALSEAWGIMALPWILLGIVSIVKQERRGWLTLMFGLIVLFLSHNLTTLMFVPASILFAAGLLVNQWWGQDRRWTPSMTRAVGVMTGSYVLAVGVAAFYLFPAFLEKDFTKVAATTTGGYFDFRLHYLYIRQFFRPQWGYGGSEWGPDDKISFFLGWGQLIALMTTIILACRWLVMEVRKRSIRWGDHHFLLVLLLILLASSAAMTLEKARFIWEHVGFFEYIQFPWRWLSLVILFLALVAGYATQFLDRWRRVVYGCLVVVIMVAGNTWYFKPEKWLDDPQSFYYTDQPTIARQMSSVLQDYVPITMPDGDQDIPTQVAAINSSAIDSIVGSNQLEILVDRPHQKLVSITIAEPATLVWSIAAFPGWNVEVDGQIQSALTTGDGLLAVEVPAGSHRVGVNWGATNIRLASDAVSLLSVIVACWLLLPSVASVKMSMASQEAIKRKDRL